MKVLLKIIFMMLIIMLIGSVALAASVTVPEDIRIGLFFGSSAKSQITISSPGGIKIGTNKDGVISYKYEAKPDIQINISKGSTPGSVNVEGYGEIGNENEYPYFKSLPKNGSFLMILNNITFNNKTNPKFRGNIEIRRFSDSDMTIINHLSMQEYLYGVVPREIGGSSPEEALKAQAITARTMAARNMSKYLKLGFNLDTKNTQAYGAYDWESDKARKAVDDTNGQVIVSNGSMISANYFSYSGGYTESCENVWRNKVDYLQAVPDTYEPQDNTTWEVTMTQDQLKKKIGSDIGDIVDIIPTEFSSVGRVTKLKVVGTKGTKEYSKEKARTILGLKSQWFSVNSAMPEVKTGTPNDVSDNKEANVEINKINSIIEEKEENKSGESEWWLKEIADESTSEKSANYNQDASKYTKEFEDEFIDIELKSGEEYIIIDSKKSDSGDNNKIDKKSGDAEVKNENVVTESKNEDGNKEIIEPLFKKMMNIFNIFATNNVNSKDTKYLSSSVQNTFVFRGRGWGHAVGMSQDGAIGMAKNGFTAEQIIKWYYTGVDIVS